MNIRNNSSPLATEVESTRVPHQTSTWVVDTISDVVDSTDGVTSLREAIEAAQDGQVITFANGLKNSIIKLNGTELKIEHAVTIDGDINADNQPDITVDAVQKSRIFNIDDGKDYKDLSVVLNALNLTGGTVDNDGGAIYSEENLEVNYSNISGNFARYEGGGIWASTANINNSNICDNLATYEGGGVWASTANINNSTISGNWANEFVYSDLPDRRWGGGGVRASTANVSNSTISGNNAIFGGGIRASTANIDDSTISGNLARNEGGGIQASTANINNTTISGNWAWSEGGGIQASTANINNTTISGNWAWSEGGGVLIEVSKNSPISTSTINNSTVTNNFAPIGSGIAASYPFPVPIGSSIATDQDEDEQDIIKLTSTIVSGNDNTDIDFINHITTNPFVSNGFNLIGDGNALAAFNKTGDITDNKNPGLAPIADNGGSTLTHALLPDSPAIDSGSNPNKFKYDQRGPGFPRAVGPVDIGAFELQSGSGIPTKVSIRVNPKQVAEDGRDNLIYTFRRTGNLSQRLEANFGVFGQAKLNQDYRLIGSKIDEKNRGTVVFRPNSKTATIKVNPTRDRDIEKHEEVKLRLLNSKDYQLGAQKLATGIIANDDLVVNLRVNPKQVAEDGRDNLIYTFRRTGNLSQRLEANFGVFGQAKLNQDYRLIGSKIDEKNRGTVVFRPNSKTATIKVNPTRDRDIEKHEEVKLRLLNSKDYQLGAQKLATGIISNDDLLAVESNPQNRESTDKSAFQEVISDSTYSGMNFVAQADETILNNWNADLVSSPTSESI